MIHAHHAIDAVDLIRYIRAFPDRPGLRQALTTQISLFLLLPGLDVSSTAACHGADSGCVATFVLACPLQS